MKLCKVTRIGLNDIRLKNEEFCYFSFSGKKIIEEILGKEKKNSFWVKQEKTKCNDYIIQPLRQSESLTSWGLKHLADWLAKILFDTEFIIAYTKDKTYMIFW